MCFSDCVETLHDSDWLLLQGLQRRGVQCVDDFGIQAPMTKCPGGACGDGTRPCTATASCYRCIVGSFSGCTATCRMGATTGFSTRDTYCGSSDGVRVNLSYCPEATQSGGIRSELSCGAKTQPCPALPSCGSCRYTSWSTCTVTCQNGTKVRAATHCMNAGNEVECFRAVKEFPLQGYQRRGVSCATDSEEVLPMAMCGGCEPDVRECGEDFPPCVLYNVQLTLWGACSVTCGQGVVSRRVVCIASPGGEVPLSRCGNVELTQLGSLSRPCAMCPVSTTQDPTPTPQSPSPTQGRDTRADVTYSFMPGPCSVTCGSGTTQTVSAQCVSSTNVVVDRSLCAGQSLQPQPCSMQPCAVDVCAGRYVLFSHRASASRDPCVLRPSECFVVHYVSIT